MKQFPKFYKIEDLRREYERTSQGHWFSQDTMRFFGTRLTSNFKIKNEKTYFFITTEKNFSGERRASIRKCTLKKDSKNFYGYKMEIGTVGDFHSLSLYQAKLILKGL